MSISLYKLVSSFLIACLLSQMVACGLILHPERKGQKAGQIDPAIALFDAIGLLFFLVPGVIAFAVDFYSGTIYLPGGKRAQLTPEELQDIKTDSGVDRAALTKALQTRGIEVNPAELQVESLQSHEEIKQKMNNFSRLYASVN